MYIIQFDNPDLLEVSQDHGRVDVLVEDDIYYVCYHDLDEDGNAFNENDDDSDDLNSDELSVIERLNSLSLQKVDSDQLVAMISYHLNMHGLLDGQNVNLQHCHRFDLDSRLYDYNIDTFNSFKTHISDSIELRLKTVLESRSKSDMDNDLSQLLYEQMVTRVVVSGKSVWYYENQKWNKSGSDNFLWNYISFSFIRFLESNPEFIQCALYLNSYAARKRILEDTKLKLSYPNFETKLDANKETVGVTNGTLNITTGKVQESKLTDFISKNTNVYFVNYDFDGVEMSILRKILRKVFPDPDLLRFFIRSCSTFLEGENSKKVFYVWWGSGNNCKTGMETLIQSAFGEYCGTAPVSLITSKRSGASEATPELCHIEGKLVVFLQEPNRRERMKTGRIKELTGNDKIFVRNLFQAGREIDVKCKIVHVCNFPTVGPDADVAFKRRMVVIKFPSTFLPEDEYNKEKRKGNLERKSIFKIQEGVEDKLRSLGGVFLSLVVQEFKAFKELGLQTPDIVKKNTEEFLISGNYVLKYIRSQLSYSEENGNEFTPSEIYESFKIWFRCMYPSFSIPNIETFIKELNDEGYEEDINGVINHVVISDANINISLE